MEWSTLAAEASAASAASLDDVGKVWPHGSTWRLSGLGRCLTVQSQLMVGGECDTHDVMTPRELREKCPAGGGPYACPCCKLPTLEARVMWEICRECSWEDDGQDDLNADEVWGGPNGADSLTDARLRYAKYVATVRAIDSRSVANGGRGRWFEARLSYRRSRDLPERFEQSACSSSDDLAP
ncbi:CPCC family cysteine-rich protein [Streptomyces sp. NPDC087263]|uniref:CPCC family cysteine-rich protein n=1 Tax=Streptomyces sp. NPDC087263 TaxID=3365773 RepID=UPI003813FE9C